MSTYEYLKTDSLLISVMNQIYFKYYEFDIMLIANLLINQFYSEYK